ncbi:MAG: HAD family hydrolase [Alphaproteobacteria bacterium]|nr:MAG: HAD family hydrolase [Alphaproteobacteria bacterium]
MTSNVFLDLDGTLLDVRNRLYDLFQELMPASTFTREEYWNLKRQKINQPDLLARYFNVTGDEAAAFKQAWLAQVEDPHRLATDVPLPGVTQWLQQHAATHNLFLVTARQHPQRVEQQLSPLGWLPYFKQVIVTRQASSKADLIRQSIPQPLPGVMVGDTGEDIRTAQSLGLTAIAVSSGFLGADVLAEYSPHHVFSTLTEIPDHVL